MIKLDEAKLWGALRVIEQFIHCVFVGGPANGSWGCMDEELDWPEEGGRYKMTNEEDEDGLRIFLWESYAV